MSVSSLWVVALGASIVMLGYMGRPYVQQGDYDFGMIFRLFWLIPIFGVWTLYFALAFFFGR